MKIKILYVVSKIDYSLGFEWLGAEIDKSRFELYFIFLNHAEPQLINILRKYGHNADFIFYKDKFSLPSVVLKIYKVIKSVKPHTVHAHLFDACIASLPIAKLTSVPQRIYTRHHSNYHHVYHKNMIKYDRIINSLCTHIVSISQNVSSILINLENVPAKKIKLIHHGFDLNASNYIKDTEVNNLKEKFNIQNKFPVIGVISRYTEWKGVQFIIPAFKELLKDYPGAHLILANASGEYAGKISELLCGLSSSSFTEIKFEKNIFALYKLFDIFVHVPVDAESEAFGQTYIEALIAKVPSVFTMSGVAPEFIVNKQNAMVVPYKSSSEILKAINCLLNNKDLCIHLKERGSLDVKQLFPLKKMISSLEKLYEFES